MSIYQLPAEILELIMDHLTLIEWLRARKAHRLFHVGQSKKNKNRLILVKRWRSLNWDNRLELAYKVSSTLFYDLISRIKDRPWIIIENAIKYRYLSLARSMTPIGSNYVDWAVQYSCRWADRQIIEEFLSISNSPKYY